MYKYIEKCEREKWRLYKYFLFYCFSETLSLRVDGTPNGTIVRSREHLPEPLW